MLCNGQYRHFMVSTLHDILQDLGGGGGGGGVQGCRILGAAPRRAGAGRGNDAWLLHLSSGGGGQCSVISTEWL